MTTVVFWDIDGTLLTTGRAGVIALEAAAEEVCGGPLDLAAVRTAGLTDGEIALQIIESTGASGRATPEALLASYARHLPACLPLRAGRVLDGVHEALTALGGRPAVTSLLLTGNLRAGALAKLEHYGLDHHFPFPDAGAFCEGPEPRLAIARRAAALAAAFAAEAEGSPGTVFVIGDTEHDVACGRAIGALTVGVATGPAPRAELEAAEPWLLLDRLPEPQELLRLLGIA